MGFRDPGGFRLRFHEGSLSSDGTWRSPVAHLNGVQGVAGSNPAVPTHGSTAVISACDDGGVHAVGSPAFIVCLQCAKHTLFVGWPCG